MLKQVLCLLIFWLWSCNIRIEHGNKVTLTIAQTGLVYLVLLDLLICFHVILKDHALSLVIRVLQYILVHGTITNVVEGAALF